MEQPLPYATPALAKAVWEHQSSASARSVARALGAAGYPVHWVTVARWRRTGWQPIEPARRHPLALARAGLESVAPVVTGIPTTSIKDLIKEYPNRESLEKLTDAELLRMAAREVAMALVIIARTIQARAISLVSTNAGGVADLLKSVATALDAVGSAFVQALTLRRGG
jgi:hypothetical protein